MTLREFFRKHMPLVPRRWLDLEETASRILIERHRKEIEQRDQLLADLHDRVAPTICRAVNIAAARAHGTRVEVRLVFHQDLLNHVFQISKPRAIAFLSDFVGRATAAELNALHFSRPATGRGGSA